MLISANTVDELNIKVNEMLSQGMYLWGSPFTVSEVLLVAEQMVRN